MVTVALAVLNGGVFLWKAVRSFLNQSLPHRELLLLDDGSTDEAIDRLPFLGDSRIVVNRNGQPIRTRVPSSPSSSSGQGKVSRTYGP